MTMVLSSQVTWIRTDIEENETIAIGHLEIVEVFLALKNPHFQ